MSKELWGCIRINSDVEIKKISSTSDDSIYNVIIDKKNNYVSCNCPGFLSHGRCKHIRYYKEYIRDKLYPDEKIALGLIENFKTIKSKVKHVLLEKPELLEENQYSKIFGTVFAYFPDTIGKETTIERTYRWLKRHDQEVLKFVPIDTEIKSEKQEAVMHQIHNWDKDARSNGDYNQTLLVEES